MIPNTVEVTDKVETQSERVKIIDFSLWESRSRAVNDFIRYYSFAIAEFEIISVLGFLLVISAVLGFGFYLWHLKSSNEQTQSRLLNILYGYLSAVCMTFSPVMFNLILHLQSSTTKIYSKDVPDDELMENEQMIVESMPHMESLSRFCSFSFPLLLSSTTSSQEHILACL